MYKAGVLASYFVLDTSGNNFYMTTSIQEPKYVIPIQQSLQGTNSFPWAGLGLAPCHASAGWWKKCRHSWNLPRHMKTEKTRAWCKTFHKNSAGQRSKPLYIYMTFHCTDWFIRVVCSQICSKEVRFWAQLTWCDAAFCHESCKDGTDHTASGRRRGHAKAKPSLKAKIQTGELYPIGTWMAWCFCSYHPNEVAAKSFDVLGLGQII